MIAPTPVAMSWENFFPPNSPVAALPSWRRPRLLIPASTLRERLVGGAFYPAFRLTGRIYRVLVRSKAAFSFRCRCSGSRNRSLLDEFLDDILPGARVRAVQVGMPGPARKLTAQLAGERGRVVGYVKCASLPLARERLAREYRLLLRLPQGTGPVPARYGSADGFDLLLLYPVLGRTVRATVAPGPELRRLNHALSRRELVTLNAHPWVQALTARAGDVMTHALEALDGREWAVTIQHGDLAPWNLIQDPGGRLTAIDWEYGFSAGFPGLDLAQYILQVALLICRWRPDRAREYAIYELQQDPYLMVTRRQAAALVGLAAYQAFCKALSDSHTADHPLQAWRREIWSHRP
jgi:hypothetical protein